MTRKGWVKEPARHSLAARGLKTTSPSKSISLESLKGKNLTRSKDRHPGKFEATNNIEFAQALQELSLEGGADDDIGDEECGWFGIFRNDFKEYGIKEDGKLVVGVIVSEDSNGFFSYQSYHNMKLLNAEWKEITKYSEL